MSRVGHRIPSWILSHIGIKRDKKTDMAAKSALNMADNKVKIPFSNLKPVIKKFFYTKW